MKSKLEWSRPRELAISTAFLARIQTHIEEPYWNKGTTICCGCLQTCTSVMGGDEGIASRGQKELEDVRIGSSSSIVKCCVAWIIPYCPVVEVGKYFPRMDVNTAIEKQLYDGCGTGLLRLGRKVQHRRARFSLGAAVDIRPSFSEISDCVQCNFPDRILQQLVLFFVWFLCLFVCFRLLLRLFDFLQQIFDSFDVILLHGCYLGPLYVGRQRC